MTTTAAPRRSRITAPAAAAAGAAVALHLMVLAAWPQPAAAPRTAASMTLVALPPARAEAATGRVTVVEAPSPPAAAPGLQPGGRESSAPHEVAAPAAMQAAAGTRPAAAVPRAPAGAARPGGAPEAKRDDAETRLDAAASRASAPSPDTMQEASRADAVPVLATVALAAVPAAGAASAAASANTPALPTYPTRVPPAATIGFDLRRGPVPGEARLSWQPGPDRYELRLEGRSFGVLWIGQTSSGGFDGAGLAPLRFVDQRRQREVRAANFQRDRGLVSFSGPQVTYPLVPGTQDRLSWLLQVAAIAAADPGRWTAGSQIEMFVVGSRGDGGVWRFDVVGTQRLVLPGGAVERALHLRRTPRKPYDTEVDFWLDPARHHLPVRLRLATPENGESTDFELRTLTLP
jgi:hypothetical protein